ncbi:hypothetical protein ACWCQZ_40605 [Streptomyces sp. NPDC002285]
MLDYVSPRLGVDSVYLRRADAAYRDLSAIFKPAGADPIHEHLQHESGVSHGLAAAPR